jgi:hypothetical protein
MLFSSPPEMPTPNSSSTLNVSSMKFSESSGALRSSLSGLIEKFLGGKLLDASKRVLMLHRVTSFLQRAFRR